MTTPGFAHITSWEFLPMCGLVSTDNLLVERQVKGGTDEDANSPEITRDQVSTSESSVSKKGE
jgi:hypothetical protein